jgi:hypothetical protein
MGFLQTVREEWPVIKQAPLSITLAVLVLTAAATAVIYAGFHENLAREDDLITTLRGQLDAKKKPATDTTVPSATGAATTTGSNSPATTGSNNTFNQGTDPKQRK